MAIKLRRLVRPSRNRRSSVFDLSTKGWLDKDTYLAGWFDVALITLTASSTITAAGASEELTQSSASSIVIATGASLGRAQGAATRVIAYAGASNGLSQGTGDVGSAATGTAGASEGLSQSAGAVTVIARGGSEGLTQSAGKPIVVTSGASQGLTQSSGLSVTVSVVTAAGASYSVSQVAGLVAVDTPVTPSAGAGGGGGGRRTISFEEADRLKKQLRNLEIKRRLKWKEKKQFESKIEQIYRDLYETQHREALVEVAPIKLNDQERLSVNKTDFSPLIKDLSAIRKLLDLYQFWLDDEEAIALLLLT